MSIHLIYLLLFTKHFIADFPLQGPFQYKNKGTYGHPGGIVHAAIQAAFTIIFLVPFFFGAAVIDVVLIALLEGVVHYHIDWAKMNLNRHWGLKPDNSEQFWWLLGFDQYLHYLTYLAIAITLA